MKTNKFFIGMASLVAAMAFTACSQDEAELQQSNHSKGSVISLTYQLAQTRATSDPQTSALSTSNKVGVFVTSGSTTITNGNNNEHSVGAAGALNFAHKLSQLQITIQNDANVDLSSAVVTVTGTKIATTFNPSTGAIGDASGEATDIKAATISAATTVYAIVVPQDLAAETELVKITTSDKAYVAKLSSAATLAAGKAHSFTVKLVEATTPVVEVPVSLNATSITEWGTPTSLGEADMEEETVEVTSPLYATFGTPGGNASYDANTFTYTWTGTTNNVMSCFTFSNGELAQYATLKFKFTDLSGGSVRINLLFSDNKNVNTNSGYYSAGEKTITLSELNLTSSDNTAHTLADVTAIRFAGNSIGSGNSQETTIIKASEMYLEK